MSAVTVVSQVETVLTLRGAMTLPQLNEYITAESPKVKNAVAYLRNAGRLQSRGMQGGYTLYELTDMGKRHIQQASEQQSTVQTENAPVVQPVSHVDANARPASPDMPAASMQDLAFPVETTRRPGRPRVDRDAIVAAVGYAPKTAALDVTACPPKVGLLDTGELIIVVGADSTILPVAVVDRVRALLA